METEDKLTGVDIMKDVMGIIHHLKNEDALGEISKHRCIASVPFGGKYRLVDFVLSNMVNAGIRNIGVTTSLNMHSLMDHLGSGKEWGLDKRHEGLFILPTAHDNRDINTCKVDLEDLSNNLNYLLKSKQQYVVIAGSNMICNIDYGMVMQFHREKQSDITVIYKEDYVLYGDDIEENCFFEIGKDMRITAIYNKPRMKKRYKVSMDMYLMKKDLLLDILQECKKTGKRDLVKDIIGKGLHQLQVYGYEHQGYLAIINTLNNYYRHHFELLNPEVWKELFFRYGVIYTKHKDGPPAKYSDASKASNTMVANGCRIEGTVENSIIFRNVYIAKGASVKNSIIMPKVEIEEDVILDGVILDKDVLVRKGSRLIGNKDRPVVVGKKQVI